MFLELDAKGLHQSSGKEKQSCCLVFASSLKGEIRKFHVVVLQWHVQSCCFAILKVMLHGTIRNDDF